MTALTDSLAEGAVQAVLEAGELLTDPAAVQSIRSKGETDYVTNVDVAVQAFLRERLAALAPDVQFMGEEQDNSALDLTRPCWILDPVDGTTNLIHGYRQSCVSLALSVKREIVAGVIYNPYTEETFTAERDGGAFLNGAPIRVSQTAELASGIVDFGSAPYYHQHADWNFSRTKEIFLHCQDIRRLGSAALAMAAVACGRCEASYELYLKPWDYAAGLLIVQEAGGKVTDFDGNRIDPTKPSAVLASNGLIHEEIREYLGGL